MGGDLEKVYLDSDKNKKIVYPVAIILLLLICIVLGVLYGLCVSTKEPCTLCYNEGTLIQENNTCTCVEGYGGECCDCEIQDCEVTPWSEWSTCTQVCGPQGTRFRNRSVATHPACGGAPCFRILLYEEEGCNRKCYNNGTLDDDEDSCTCPDGYSGHCCGCKIQDCVMTPWSNWSACSHACGPHGMAKRTRDVETVPTCGGAECSGVLIQQKPCNRMCDNDGILNNDAGECKCPDGFSGQCCQCENVDCQLSNWTDWSTCDNATRQERSRYVKRYPKCAGNECDGSLTEDRSCEVTQLKQELLVYKWSVGSLAVVIGISMLVVIIYCIIRRKRNF
ncbi:sushi, nidogen and EGF-like domain-containing protein 1 isoform X2 [Anneissia japonica]|uniref:sushi, nidogen and EGF-like domain-containing protein 1 isoform X1 n=1 Tax=Anneissia japonica TaxID=1529436 RepID=UPI001425BA1C|nr:sushi, nidogen and EGF-like domain-containing protein 1 isoform X1 [Anneissia japonica]XP_033116910.1 sushi, nidogen and EGF-like domain-containing protein 1 isoform X2 [Anneissia japonica]